MMTRFRMLCLTGALALAAQVLTAGDAFAHHVFVGGNASCASDGPGIVINYLVTTDSGPNPQVDVYLNNNVVATGAFSAQNNYQFGGVLAAPSGAVPGDTVMLGAMAVEPVAK